MPPSRQPAGRPPQALTPRQREILSLVRARFSNAEIASKLGVSVNTVRAHLKAVTRGTGPRHRSGRRGGNALGPRLPGSEAALLTALLGKDDLVGELARRLGSSPQALRRLLGAVAKELERDAPRSRARVERGRA